MSQETSCVLHQYCLGPPFQNNQSSSNFTVNVLNDKVEEKTKWQRQSRAKCPDKILLFAVFLKMTICAEGIVSLTAFLANKAGDITVRIEKVASVSDLAFNIYSFNGCPCTKSMFRDL